MIFQIGAIESIELVGLNASCKLPNVSDDIFGLFMFHDNLGREDKEDDDDRSKRRPKGDITLMSDNSVDGVVLCI